MNRFEVKLVFAFRNLLWFVLRLRIQLGFWVKVNLLPVGLITCLELDLGVFEVKREVVIHLEFSE